MSAEGKVRGLTPCVHVAAHLLTGVLASGTEKGGESGRTPYPPEPHVTLGH